MSSPHTLSLSVLVAASLILFGCGEPSSDGRPTPPDLGAPDPDGHAEDPAAGAGGPRTVYVPAYSHLGSARDNPVLFAVTLSVRNIDPSATVVLRQVDYYDTSGHRVRRHLSRPRSLRPLETAEFEVGTFDETGGSGANFLVHWDGPTDTQPLLTETVMVGHISAGYVSFTSRGVELVRPPAIEPEPEAEPEPSGSVGMGGGDAPEP